MSKGLNTDQALLDAVRNKQYEKAEEILDKLHGRPEAVKDETGNTALHLAVINNDPAMTKLLLLYRFDQTQFNSDLCTPAVLAAELGHWQCLNLFAIHKDADLRACGLGTALLHTVKEREYETSQTLLKNGAPRNAIWTRTQFSPLHWAIHNQDSRMTQLLIQHDADQTLLNNSGHTPLEQAWRSNAWPCLVALCQKSALSQRDYSRALLAAAKANHYQAVLALLKAGANPSECASEQGYTALHWAVVKKNPELFALLLRYNGQLNAYDEHQQTPVHLAFKFDCASIGSWFSALNIDLNIQDNTEAKESARAAGIRCNTQNINAVIAKEDTLIEPLRLAIAQNDLERISQLLTEDEQLLTTAFRSNQQSPLSYALALGQQEVISLVKAQFAEQAPLQALFEEACQKGLWDCAKAIDLEQGIARELDNTYYNQLAWYSFHNTDIKQAMIEEAEKQCHQQPMNQAKFLRHMAETKTACYRQLMFWSSAPTHTTERFTQQLHTTEVESGPTFF